MADDSDDEGALDECQICEKVMSPTNPPHIGSCSHCVCMRCLRLFDRIGYDCPFCKVKNAFEYPIRNNLALDLLDNAHHLEAQLRRADRTNGRLQRLLEIVKKNHDDLLIDAQIILKNKDFGAKLTWRKNPFRKLWRKITRRGCQINYITETTDIYEDDAEDMRLRLLGIEALRQSVEYSERLHKNQALEEENRILKNAVNEMTVSYQEKDEDWKKLNNEYRVLVNDRNNLLTYNHQYQRDLVHLERQIEILLFADTQDGMMNGGNFREEEEFGFMENDVQI